MTEDEVRRFACSCVLREAPFAVAGSAPAAELKLIADLGYDSLRLMELITLIEDELPSVEIPEARMLDVETVEDVQCLVLEALGRSGLVT